MIDFDYIECGDCLELIKGLPDNSVDLIVTDPPYVYKTDKGGGAFGSNKRNYHSEYISLYKETGTTKETERLRIDANKRKHRDEIKNLSNGFNISILDELDRVMKKTNIYVWCSKAQVRKILEYYEDKGCSIDILTWHKTNPTPTCNNTYLSDTEYCIFAREKGVKVYGSYATKKKYYVSPANVADKKLYNHPTIKPLEIIQNLIINSSLENDIILDPYLGSGTTAVACVNTGRHYIGFELNPKYYDTACKRLDEVEVNKLEELSK